MPRQALQEVELPSGWKVRGVVPQLFELARWDLIPSDLLDTAANHWADKSWFDRATVAPDELKRRSAEQRRLTHLMVIAFVRDEWTDDEWQPVTLTPEDIGPPPRRTVDPSDLDALENIVLGRVTPAQVTTAVREARDAAAEAAATEEALATFPAESTGPAPGADSGGDGDPSVRPARRRSRRAAGAGVPGG